MCNQNKNFCYDCTYCEFPIELEGGGSLYVCLECPALLHKSCAELPMEIKEHPLHPSHTLSRVAPNYSWFTCSVCSQRMCGFRYRCDSCDFFLDVHCAALKPTESNKGSELYADLPQKINHHLLHPHHALTLFSFTHILARCKACLQCSSAIFFRCRQCPWYIDIRCALAKYTSLMSKIHPHPLIFFNKANNLFECNSCGQCCYTPFFRCFRCDFNLHIHCVSILPSNIKYKNHVHHLTAFTPADSLMKDGYAEFYCDACEELRVPGDRSYYCEECTYVAHPHCIVSEIISILKEEWPELESNASGSIVEVTHVPEEACSKQECHANPREVEEPPPRTLKEFLDSIAWFDMHKISNVYNNKRYNCTSDFIHLDKIIDLIVDDYESANQNSMPWQDWDSTSRVVKVGEYMIREDLAPILETLFSKYGEFSCSSVFSPKLMMLCMMVVCDAISGMRNTKVKNVTAHLILSWYRALMVGLEAQFKISFAFYRLTRVARAHFGVEANLPTDEDIKKLEKKLEKKRALRGLGAGWGPYAVNLKGQSAGEGLL